MGKEFNNSKLIDTDKLIDYEEVARIAHEHQLSDEEIREFVKGLKPTIVSRSEFTDEILKELGMEGQFISSKDYQNYIAKKEDYKETFRDKVLEAGLARTQEEDEKNHLR